MIRNWKKTGVRTAALLLGGALALPAVFSSTAHAATSYTAKEGDTFWLLSKRFDVPLQTLMNANKNIDPMKILPGHTIIIPNVKATPYTAKKGDTFWTLSKRFGIPLQTLMDANKNIDPMNIYPGLTIMVPNANAKPAAATPASAPAAQTVTTMAGETLTYSKLLTATATAYSSAPEENGGWGAVDYFGNPLKLGTIAVDPKVIPFGTNVYITGYNHAGLPEGGMIAKATDTGGAIKGNRIDIFIPGSRDFVRKFGIQDVKVYVLK